MSFPATRSDQVAKFAWLLHLAAVQLIAFTDESMNPFKKIITSFNKEVVRLLRDELVPLRAQHEDAMLLLGKLMVERNRVKYADSKNIVDYEFKVFSQFGEDGIIQYLIEQIEIPNRLFIEFGVENYRESNTRFLLQNNNWKGLVFDGSERNIASIKKEDFYFLHTLQAEQAFITKENINDLIAQNGYEGDIGLLSIDIDGNDYWVWESIDVVQPRIVICEYNSLLGDKAAVSIPYKHDFDRATEHFSFLYFGASIAALTQLGKRKGYSLVGSNSAGNNLFFVRNDSIGDIPTRSPQEAYVKSRFRESRDSSGTMSALCFDEALQEINEMPLFDIESGNIVTMQEFVD